MSSLSHRPLLDTTSPTTATMQDAVGTSPAPDLVGNQGRVEDAGLAGECSTAQSPDILDGDMAGMVLECMPLDHAVVVANDHFDNPSVQAWAQRQEPAEFATCMIAAELPQSLSWWPVGTGCEGNAAIGADFIAGGRLALQGKAVRTGEDNLDLTMVYDAQVSLGGESLAGYAATNGWGETIASAGAGLGYSVGLTDTATTSISFDVADLFVAGTMLALSPVDLMGQTAGTIVEMGAVAGIFEREYMDDAWSLWDHAIHVSAGGEASANAIVDPEAGQIPGLAVDLFAEALGPLVALEGLVGANLSMEVSEKGGLDLVLAGSVAALVDLTAVASVLDLGVSSADVDALGELVGQDGGFELRAGVHDLVSSRHDATFKLTSGRTDGDTEQRDSLELPLVEAIGFAWDRLSTSIEGQTFADLVAQAPASTWTRQVETQVDASRLEYLLPEGFNDLVGVAGRGTNADARLSLVGTCTVGADALAAVARSTDFLLPPDLGALGALAEVSAAIATVRFGGVLPAWLAPHRAALEVGAAMLPDLQQARLIGRMGMAVGGGREALEVGAELGGNGSMVVDMAVEGDDLTRLELATAS